MSAYHLAELNIARLKAPLDHPDTQEFTNNIAAINALAEASPGFIWRLQDDSTGDATSIRLMDDPLLIINLSVWDSVESLFQYTYYSGHADFFRRRAEWFGKLELVGVVLWWIEAGQYPTLEQAHAKLEHLNAHGPTPQAFSFKQRYTVEEWLAGR
jgi:hypothetical protein